MDPLRKVVESRASNPGRLRVNLLQWLRHKPIWPILFACAALVSLAGALLLHWSLWIAAGFFLLCNLLYWFNVHMHFRHGDANPGVVVSVDPLLIAVATDLTQGVGSYPAVKLFRANLSQIAGAAPEYGKRVATVSTYRMNADGIPHWRDVTPYPAEYATNNEKAIQRLMQTFTEDDWAHLEEMLKRVPQPFQPGLYMLDADVHDSNESASQPA